MAGWTDVVARVLGRYTYNGNETAYMIDRLRENDVLSLARGQWLGGKESSAEALIERAVQEMGYKRK